MQQRVENIGKEDGLKKQIVSLVEFGKQNNGWGGLLELREIENIVFQVGTSWQEIKPLMTEKDVLENQDIKSTIKIINDSYDALKDLVRGIKDILQSLKNSNSAEMIKKADAGVVLRILQTQDGLVNFSTKMQGDITSLIALMQEFQSLYIKWMNSKGSFKKLLNELNKYNDANILKSSSGLSSKFVTNPGEINSNTNSDTRWGWGRDRY